MNILVLDDNAHRITFFKNALKYKRLRFPWNVLALLPDSQGKKGFWGGVCLYGKAPVRQ